MQYYEEHDFQFRMHKKPFVSQLRLEPLGELVVLSQLLSWVWEMKPTGTGKGHKGKRWKRSEERRWGMSGTRFHKSSFFPAFNQLATVLF